MAPPSRKSAPSTPPESGNTRAAILVAALKAFSREGYDGASMPKIARLANVAPPLIHYYFGSKEKLWREAVDHSLGELRREAETICAATRSLAPLDRLRALLQAHTQFAAKWPDHFFMIIAEARSDTDRFQWVQANYTGLLYDQVVDILRDARAAGAIRDVRLDQVAITLISGILLYFTVYPSQWPDREIGMISHGFCDQMVDMLLNGIATR